MVCPAVAPPDELVLAALVVAAVVAAVFAAVVAAVEVEVGDTLLIFTLPNLQGM